MQAVFGERGDAAGCQCQWYRMPVTAFHDTPREVLAERLAEQSHCGEPHADSTTGFLAFEGDDPIGWCAVAPRTDTVRLATMRVPWVGRPDEDRSAEDVWAVTCFTVRVGHRGRGVAQALAVAAVEFARERGAAAVEGYPIVTRPGKRAAAGELFVGDRDWFAQAGFVEVARPSERRAVMRVDF
nr:GNAT family N-acetyltransferase [Agromyces seonyuensis]